MRGSVRGWLLAAALCGSGCSEHRQPPPPSVHAGAGTPPPSGSGGALAAAPAGSAPVPPQAESPPRTARVSLIDHSRWTLLGAGEDPFGDRPADLTCAAEAVKAEALGAELTYGVDTGSCSYVTAHQAALQDVRAGETVVVRLWHFGLNAPNPGEAHAVVDIDGLRVLDERVPIPAPGGLIRVAAPIARAIAAGAPVLFHLHNHGDNSWALVEISTGP